MRFLFIFLSALALSGCIGCYVPSSTVEIINIDKNLPKEEVIRIIQEVVRDNPSINVSSNPKKTNYPLFEPKITSIDLEEGKITFNLYGKNPNLAGYGAKITLESSHLRLYVEGIGPYCMSLSDEAVAEEFSALLKKRFSAK